MLHAVDPDRAHACAKIAFEHMDSHGVAPTPDNYELWFTYATGVNRDLVDAMDALRDRAGPIAQGDLDALHGRFLDERRMSDAVMEMGGRMRAELDRVMECVTLAGRDSTTYGTALAHATGELGKNGNSPAFHMMLDTLLTATRQMQARTQSLEQELHKSSSEISQLRDNLDTIHKETLTDQLTGLTNRRGFDEALREAMEQASRTAASVCLILADIDHFKRINDTFGHLTGDQILRLTARCLKETVTDRDTAARYGGEEFAIILEDTALEEAVRMADQIRKSVESKKVVKRSTGESLGTVTISLGIAVHDREDTPESLIDRADQCLYAAKNAGRNRVVAENHRDAPALATGG